MITIKTEHDIRWIPPVQELQNSEVNQHGWLRIDGKTTWEIVDIHSFDDFGTTVETLVIRSGNETKIVYSLDECETFTFDLE